MHPRVFSRTDKVRSNEAHSFMDMEAPRCLAWPKILRLWLSVRGDRPKVDSWYCFSSPVPYSSLATCFLLGEETLEKIGLKILRTESLFHSLSSFRRQRKEIICEMTGRTEIEDCSCLNSIRVMSYCFHIMDCSFTWVKISYSTDGIRWFNCETYYFYLFFIPSQNYSVWKSKHMKSSFISKQQKHNTSRRDILYIWYISVM